ncbi:helix-turn-helix transcriptional regulator [Phytoactinopolyspora halotolerans]|uniref:HTH luxR-type domain-containing protein n=1 Tax=Phytoactinopolyspora halotolerans TaxID=1981512 RepID=A0A6L9SD48_9ACTN|nr:LuxR C-terminal-related transcriptional regulator [Phytoactinopolyspora halotolerans]NEE03295.1 hypothetical protein [Phytoactinopolyspora halotolerans]
MARSGPAGEGWASRQTLARQRLLRRIVGTDAAPLTVLHGPAGLGKSVLLGAAARRAAGGVVIRISADDDPTTVLDDLPSDAGKARRLILVDDADEATEDALDAVVAYGRAHGARIVVAARRALGTVTSAMMMNGDARVVSTGDMLFTLDEVRALASKYRREIGPDDVAELYRVTDGWPAMVDAALRSPRTGDALTRRRLHELFGRFVREDVIGSIPDAELERLSDAAAIPRFDVPVLATLLNDRFGPDVDAVDVLDRWFGHGWIVHDDLDDHWRFPQPLRDGLLTDLEARHPGRRGKLVTKAVQLLVADGRTTVALPYLVEASLDDVVANVLRERWTDDVAPRGDYVKVRTAHASVTDEMLANDPSLLLLSAVYAMRHPADLPTIELRLAQAADVIDRGSFNGPLLSYHSLSMMLARFHGDLDRAEAMEWSARGYLDTATDEQRHEQVNRISHFTLQVGLTRLAAGRIDEADTAVNSALSTAKNNRAEWYAANAEAALAYTSFLRGELKVAQDAAESALVRARALEQPHANWTDHAQIARGLVELEYGRAWRSREILHDAYEALQIDAEPPAARLAAAWSTLGLLTGDRSAAEQALLLCEAGYATNRLPFNRFLATIARAHARLVQDDPKAALEELARPGDIAGQAHLVHITRARAHLIMGNPLDARRELAGYHDDASLPLTARADVHALAAECALQLGEDASHPFYRMLALLEFTGARRPILQLPLLSDAVVTGRLSPSPTSALVRLGVETAVLARANVDGPPSLTDRETDVLTALSGPETLAAIAKSLYVSGNTLKTVARGLYRKLGVRDRHEAVNVARALGMLPA